MILTIIYLVLGKERQAFRIRRTYVGTQWAPPRPNRLPEAASIRVNERSDLEYHAAPVLAAHTLSSSGARQGKVGGLCLSALTPTGFEAVSMLQNGRIVAMSRKQAVQEECEAHE